MRIRHSSSFEFGCFYPFLGSRLLSLFVSRGYIYLTCLKNVGGEGEEGNWEEHCSCYTGERMREREREREREKDV